MFFENEIRSGRDRSCPWLSDLDHGETLEVAGVDRALLHELGELPLGVSDRLRSPLAGTVEAAAREALLHTPCDVLGNLAGDVGDFLNTDVTELSRVAVAM